MSARKGDMALYKSIMAKLKAEKAKGKVFTMPIVQPATLRVEAQLLNGTGTYNFFINENSGGIIKSTERKLNANDSFVAKWIGVRLKKEDPNAANGQGVLYTYPYATVFNAVANEFDPTHVEALYNGFLSIKIGDTVFAKHIDINGCRVINTGATERSDEDGFIEITPRITFDGGGNNQLTITFPTWANQLLQYVAGANRVSIVLDVAGFLLSNGGKLGINFN